RGLVVLEQLGRVGRGWFGLGDDLRFHAPGNALGREAALVVTDLVADGAAEHERAFLCVGGDLGGDVERRAAIVDVQDAQARVLLVVARGVYGRVELDAGEGVCADR